jgi:hypothetical protein
MVVSYAVCPAHPAGNDVAIPYVLEGGSYFDVGTRLIGGASTFKPSRRYRFVDRMAYALCPVFCRIIFVGEYHDADPRALFFLL